MITMPSYRLGAEELIELGRAKNAQNAGRQPFFSGRPRLAGGGYRLDDVQALAQEASKAGGEHVAATLGLALSTLGNLVNVPVSTLAQGADITAGAVSGLLKNVPVMGDLLAEILVLGVTATKHGLAVPGLTSEGLDNVLAGIGQAFSAKYTTLEVDRKIGEARDGIVTKTQGKLKAAVRHGLDAAWASEEKISK